MPIEKRDGESRDEFISRCISQEIEAGKEQDQAVAICISKADEEFASATQSVSDATWSSEAPINVSFSAQKRVIFNEDFDAEQVKELKEKGFKVFIRSSRKVKKKDRKVWNKLKIAGLNEDALVFGDLENLHKRYNFDLFMTGDDPISEALSVLGRPYKPGKIIYEEFVNSLDDAKEKQALALKNVDLKFIRVVSRYVYDERPGVAPAASGSRPFCKKRMDERREYSLEEIDQLSNAHLVKQFKNYAIDPDVFLYRGGWYREPGTDQSTPYCRHQWKLIVKIEN